MAHKKGQASSRNGRDSSGQRLGVKCYAQELVKAGSIILRQRGTKIFPGMNVGRAKDDSLFALAMAWSDLNESAGQKNASRSIPFRKSVFRN